MFSQEFNLSNLLTVNGGDGTEGFVINGIALNDNLGISVSGAGDINGDGIDDLIIGASGSYDPSSSSNPPGKNYVIFGKSTNDAEINLSDIVNGDGSDGFVVNGIDSADFSGYSVSGAGDVNGDGIDDIIIGARSADGKNNNNLSAGESYIVFGSNGLGAEINLSDIVNGDGSSGFVVYGTNNGDTFADAVSSAGDVNGDNIDDIIISAKFAEGNNTNDAGASYVIFGSNTLGAEVNLTDIVNGDGSKGFVVYGIDSYDFSGTSVSRAGDVNGDGMDDIIISANRASGNNNSTAFSGESYVIFGSNTLGAEVNLTDIVNGDGSKGFVVYGVDNYDFSGISVSSAGDFNGDRINDIIIGAEVTGGKNNNTLNSGESYVVFGGNALGAEINLVDIVNGDGSKGLVIYGIDEGDYSGGSVSSVGDINGDGIDDIIIGARGANGNNNGTSDAGESYVIFGSNALGAEINLADIVNGDGSQGFVAYGIDEGDYSGTSVSNAGDLNGDGIDDIVIGANNADGYNNGTEDAGASYIIFGKADPQSITDTVASGDNSLFGTSSSDRLEGGAGNDIVRGGDGNDALDGDNGKDRLFGDGGTDNLNGGESNDFLQGGNGNDTVTGGDGNDILFGDAGNDTLLGDADNDILNGDGGRDFIDGGTGIDRMLGGADADTFVIRPGDTDNIIYDFEDNSDLIHLVAGLTFADLSITDNGLNTGTNISQASTGDLLVTLIDVDETDITSTDFI